MRHFDLTPLFRSTIGFDHLTRLLDQAAGFDSENGYPPYNIERLAENDYRITMAVAGFTDSEMTGRGEGELAPGEGREEGRDR